MRGPLSLVALTCVALAAACPEAATALARPPAPKPKPGPSASSASAASAASAPSAAASSPLPDTAESRVIEREAAADAANELMKQAQFLQQKYRPDLARAVLLKLLAVQPDEPRAMLMLGDLALRENRLDEAQAMLTALEQRAPGTRALKDMQTLWRLYTIDRTRLDQLRLLHRGGRDLEAQGLARELFLADLPPASLYEEFGDLYGRGTPRGAMAQRNRGGGGGRAGPSRPWVETNPAILARQRGYAALGRRDHDKAEIEFRNALKRRPFDSSSLAGMGIVRLRQGRFAASSQFFQQAIRHERGDKTEWRELDRTARYWDQVAEARTAIDEQRWGDAQRLLESARKLQPADTEAALLLADVHRQRGENDAAWALYNEVLRREPDNLRALQQTLGMSLAEARTPADIDAILARADGHAQRLRLPLGDLIDPGVLRATADGLVRRGDVAAAQHVLERGVAALPADPWLRYDLARIYQDQGNPQRATALMEEGLLEARKQMQGLGQARTTAQAGQPADDSEMRQAAALIALSNGDEARALQLLGPLDAATATDAQRSLRERALFESALRRYRAALANGDKSAMNAALTDAAALAGSTPERKLRVAAAQLEAGQLAAAQALLDSMDPATLARDDALRWAQLATDADRMEAASATLSRLAQAFIADPAAGRPASTATAASAASTRAADLAYRDSLIDAQSRIAQKRIEAALAANPPRPEEARRIASEALAPWTGLATVPRAARLAQGELWLSALQPADAVAWLDTQMQGQPDDPALRLLRIRALDAAGRGDEARAEMKTLIAMQPGDADTRLEAARLAREDGDYNLAMAHLQAITPASSAGAPGAAGTGTSSGAGATTVAGGPVIRPDVQDAIDRIEARRQPRVEFGFFTADRSARQGIDALHDREASAVITWPIGYNGQMFAQVDRVSLDAGTLPTPFGNNEDFGKINALAGGADQPQPLKQSTQGENVAVGWTSDKRRVDIGIVGLNMPVQNVVGGWLERFSGQGNDYSIEASRRPLTSSLLTYAGARDPITGEVWGGVTSTGVTFRVSRDLPGLWSLGSSLRVASLDGKNVQRNTALIWRTTLDRDWIRSEEFTLNAGLVGNVWHFDHNSNFSSFGHGNYYSPQRYVSIGVPVQATGRVGSWSYLLRASLAHSWTQEDGAVYYPTSAVLQAAGNPTYAGGGHGGGFGTSWRAAVEYEMSPQWVAGAGIDIDRSTNYSPNRATVYLRHFFKPQAPALSVPPSPVTPISQY